MKRKAKFIVAAATDRARASTSDAGSKHINQNGGTETCCLHFFERSYEALKRITVIMLLAVIQRRFILTCIAGKFISLLVIPNRAIIQLRIHLLARVAPICTASSKLKEELLEKKSI